MSVRTRCVSMVAVLVATVHPSGVAFAQSAVAHSPAGAKPVARTAEDVRYHTVVSEFASTEHLLIDVRDLTDAQRDAIERRESAARDEVFRLALPLRAARREMLRGWPQADDIYERALNDVIVAQRALTTDVRDLLTPAQQVQFDLNVLTFWANHAGVRAPRAGAGALPSAWSIYMVPYVMTDLPRPNATDRDVPRPDGRR